MNPVSLTDDLKALAAQHPGLVPLVQRIKANGQDFATRAPLLGELGAQARLGAYVTLALLLKAQWEAKVPDTGRWCPWLDAERLREPHGNATAVMAACEFELLVLEQCALSCHLIGHIEVTGLAYRHRIEQELLVAASTEVREEFLADKRTWLLDEHQYDWLLLLSQQLVGELQSTRMRYLEAIGQWLVDYVEAAHRVALMRYRSALDDPTLTTEELALRLQQDLMALDAEAVFVPLEPELRQALFDTVRDVQDDYESLRHLAGLWSQGNVKPASEEDRRLAALLFRRLARLFHSDHLERHKDYAEITPENKERLKEIWNQAKGMHRSRVFLSLQKLINYVENLHGWIAEVERILRGMPFHVPSRLLIGETLGERHADLRRAMADVQRHLHAARDEIAQLEFDPQHDEYRRVIAMGEVKLKAERERMAAQTDRWNAEARSLSTALATRHPDAGDSGKPDCLEHRP
jgi:hypothetical protein